MASQTGGSRDVDRRRFLTQSGAAVMAPMFGGGVARPPRTGASRAPWRSELDERYLIAGLTGLVRAHENKGWFQAHWGAAVLAAYYICQENEFAQPLVAAIQAEADALIAKFATYFWPLAEEQADAELVDKVARARAADRRADQLVPSKRAM